MTRPELQRIKILAVLVGVLAFTLLFAYRMNRPTTASAIPPVENNPTPAPLVSNDARIRIDLVEKTPTPDRIGDTNVFQYRTREAPPQSEKPVTSGPQGSPIATGPGSNTAAATPAIPYRPAPIPPPPAPLKYQGFAAVSDQNGALTAFISDDSRSFNVRVGDVLMGRFRIVQITVTNVELEDLEYKRRQILPLLK